MKYFLYCLAVCVVVDVIWALHIKRVDKMSFLSALWVPSLYMIIVFIFSVIAVNLNIDTSTEFKRVEKVADTKEVITLNLDNSKEVLKL